MIQMGNDPSNVHSWCQAVQFIRPLVGTAETLIPSEINRQNIKTKAIYLEF